MNKTIKSVRPLLAEADYASSVQLLEKYTDYLDIAGDLSNEIAEFLEYKKNLVQSDFVNNTANTLISINGKYNSIDNQFLLPYIKIYNNSVEDIKSIVTEQAGQNSIYGDISDCIGLLGNSAYKLTDTVIPFNDIDTIVYGSPKVYPASLSAKVRSNTQSISDALSQKTTSIFRQNIINIQTIFASTDQAHGSNLITDIGEYFRSVEYSASIARQLESDFNNLFKILTFFNTVNNNTGYNAGNYNNNIQEIVPFNFNLTYNDEVINVDLLGKKINDVRSKITITNSLASLNGDIFITPTVANINTKYLKSSVKDPKTGKIVPINTNAEVESDQLLTNQVPVIPSTAKQERDVAKEVIKVQEDQEKNTIDVKVTEIPDRLLSLPLQAVQFSTQLFASATQSPLAAAQQVRDLVCRGIDFVKTFDLNIINNIPWPPKLPNEIKNFSFKRLVMKIAYKVRDRILREIYERVFAPLEAFYRQIIALKKRLLNTIDQIKDLFSCNKD